MHPSMLGTSSNYFITALPSGLLTPAAMPHFCRSSLYYATITLATVGYGDLHAYRWVFGAPQGMGGGS